jgi:hypothetical protein
MSTPTPELGLLRGVDTDDTADYLTINLANSLTTVDSLFNAATGHTHGGTHQGGPISSIPSSAIPASSITTAQLADGSVTSAKIADGTIQSVDIGTRVIASANIAQGAVTTYEIADRTIAAADIAVGAITSTEIADGTIQTVDLADGSVTSAKIADGTIQGVDLASGITLTNPTISGTMTGTGGNIVTSGVIQANNGPIKVNGTATVPPTGTGPELYFDGTSGQLICAQRDAVGTVVAYLPVMLRGNPVTLDGSLGGVTLKSPQPFQGGDRYLVINATTGQIHVSGLGPAS